MKKITNLIKRASLSTFNKKRYYLFIIMLLTLGIGSAWAAEKSFTITFKDNGSDSSSALTTTNFKNQVSESADSIKTVVSTANCYAGTGGLKSSSNKNNGSFTLQLKNQLSITKVVLNVKNKNATTKTVTVGSTSFTTTDNWNTTSFVDLEFTGTETKSDQLTISLAGTTNSKRVAYLSSITIYHNVAEDAGGSDPDEPESPTPSISVSPASHTFATTNVGETATQVFEITAANTTSELSAEISNTTDYAISVIADNKITVTYQPQSAATHEATLTIKAGEEASATVELTGKAVAALEGTWMLVTDASTLKAGDEIIIAAKDYDVALSTTQANNNRPEVEITKNGNTITATSEAQVLTLEAGNMENTLALYTGDGYLYAASSSSNYLRTETTLSDNSSWTISIADGTATLTAQGTYTRNTMFYNNSSKIFSCYAAGTTTQKALAIYKKVDESEVLAPAFSVATGSYYGAQSVEITCATDGAEIYYTLDGSAPTSSSTKYTAAISISETKTLKAIAIKGENSSSVTEATYTILAPLSTMDEIFAKATEVAATATSVKVAMNNWVVTGVKNKNVYVTDGTKGFIIFAENHGFEVGNILSGTVTCKVQLYYGSSELTELTSTTEGLTVTTGGTVTPVVVDDVTTLSGVNTGAVIKITGTCTQESSKYYVAGVQLYNSLFTFTNPTVGNKYNVTGVYLQYNSTKEILPRQQEDIEEIVDALPSATISIANITMEIGETKTIEATITPEDAPITYETTATCITLNGTTITAVSEGTATITATIADKAGEYTGATKTFTVTVKPVNIATLPFAFDGKQADIANTLGMSHEGIDASDYGSSPYLKMNTTGDYLTIHFNAEPGKLSYDIKGNSFSGGTFTVQESADGETYTDIVAYTELGEKETKTHTLAATSRYVKFIYTEKVNGNVALGNIKIALPEEEPGEGGGETPEERLTDWVLTPLADITTNDLVVITMTKGETTWAMTNDKGTSAAPVASVVTLSADALAAEPDANLKWVVSNDNGTLTIYPYGTYETWLYCTNANNGVRVGTGEAKEFTIDTDHLYTTLTNEPRYLGVYDADADTWRCYTSINSNIEDQTLAFYVKKNANDVLPGTGEDPEGGEGGEDPVVPTPTINATATFVFNTAEGLNDLGIAYPTTEDEDNVGAYKTNLTDGASFTQDGITMTSTDGTTVTRVWLTAAGKLDLRVYKNATLTFSVSAEHKISAIVFDGSNIGHLLVNGTAVSGNAWTGSEQTVTFTAKADASTIKINTIAFVVEYTRDVTNTYGTICLPYGSTNYAGATFYQVVGKEEGKVYLESVTALEAGVPYIFEKSASQIKVAYEGEAVAAPQNGDANGLVGTFEEIEVPNGMYILYNNAFCTNEPAGTLNKIRANRAYLNMNDVPGEFTKMPGRRYIGMAVEGENAETGLENIIVPEGQAVKVISNGQLIIIRDGEMYNAQGQRL